MAKFNEVQKKRRALVSNRKRTLHGDPNTRKLKRQTQSRSLSGKRKRKLLKKWRRGQKDVIEKGLVTLGDVEMAAADGPSEPKKAPAKFHLKKNVKLKAKQKKHKGKSQGVSFNPAIQVSPADVMME